MTEAAKKPAQVFEVPGSLKIERFRQREGPSPVWIIWTPGTSRPVPGSDQEAFRAILKLAKWPASTPTGEKLRAWLAEWGYVRPQKKAKKSTVSEEVKATGFGPEAHALDESDPNYATKMVT